LHRAEILVTFSEAVAILFPSALNDIAAMRLSWAGTVTTALCNTDIQHNVTVTAASIIHTHNTHSQNKTAPSINPTQFTSVELLNISKNTDSSHTAETQFTCNV